jgi:hypothetical protein
MFMWRQQTTRRSFGLSLIDDEEEAKKGGADNDDLDILLGDNAQNNAEGGEGSANLYVIGRDEVC